jgi:hypothetical protein
MWVSVGIAGFARKDPAQRWALFEFFVFDSLWLLWLFTRTAHSARRLLTIICSTWLIQPALSPIPTTICLTSLFSLDEAGRNRQSLVSQINRQQSTFGLICRAVFEICGHSDNSTDSSSELHDLDSSSYCREVCTWNVSTSTAARLYPARVAISSTPTLQLLSILSGVLRRHLSPVRGVTAKTLMTQTHS